MKENPCEAFGKSGCSPVVGKSKTGIRAALHSRNIIFHNQFPLYSSEITVYFFHTFPQAVPYCPKSIDILLWVWKKPSASYIWQG